jgi:hypothetical protein
MSSAQRSNPPAISARVCGSVSASSAASEPNSHPPWQATARCLAIAKSAGHGGLMGDDGADQARLVGEVERHLGAADARLAPHVLDARPGHALGEDEAGRDLDDPGTGRPPLGGQTGLGGGGLGHRSPQESDEIGMPSPVA